MSVDSVSDMATLIRNAITIKNPLVTLPYTKNNEIIAKILAKEGFIHCICVTTMNTSNLNQNSPGTQVPNMSLNSDQENYTQNKEAQDQNFDVSSVDQTGNSVNSETETNLTTDDNKQLATFRTSSFRLSTKIENFGGKALKTKTGIKKKVIILALKYVGREKKTMIHAIKRVSKPSLRWYLQNPIPQSLGGLGIFIVSTSFGIVTECGLLEYSNVKVD